MEKVLNVLKTKKFWIEFAIMTFGIGFGALAIHSFLIPSKLIIGSISGLSIVLNELMHMAGISGTVGGIELVSVASIYFVINAVLLVIAYIFIGKEFGLKTVYTALIMAPWLMLFEEILPIEKSVMGDPWLDLLCFVVILSAGQTILFRINASTGGLDIVAKIINKYLHIDIGNSVAITGGLICTTAFLINDLDLVFLGIIGTWINGLALNHFTLGMTQKKRICIISKEYLAIKDFIVNELRRGVTMYEVTGGFSNEKGVEIEAILARDEFATLMTFMENNSIKFFMTSGNVNEVHGEWNTVKKKLKA